MSAVDGENAIVSGVIESDTSRRSYMSALDGENAIVSGVIEFDSSCRSFSLVEIQAATNDFDDASIIGIGGFGKVYKGFIDNGTTVVAIKRLNSESKQGAKEFSAEIKILSTLQHTNLVDLIGYCNDCEEKILVYEYISRGTLADHLYKRSKTESSASNSHLSWEQRLEICVGVAHGLDYIHTGTDQSFIHRDVKTTNILLDKNWVVKISDFGLSKDIESHSVTHVTTEVKGSFGYFDPEYYLTRRLTTKSDVYAFGVVLLEVLSGRRPVDTTLEEEKHSLVLWAEQCIKKGKLREIIDPSLSGQILPRSLNYFVKVAGNCIHTSRKARPSMADVMESLELALASQHKGRKEGVITKVFQGITLVPKGMNRWFWERKDDDVPRESRTDSAPRQRKDNDVPRESRTDSAPRHFSLADVRRATNNFDKDHLIHHNGSVYKGFMNMYGSSHAVAINRFKKVTPLDWDNVRVAVKDRSLLHHPNIVPLIGFCYEEPELILVYDYMANGSLKDCLNRGENNLPSRKVNGNSEPLSWKERLEICIGVARGLQCLHQCAEPQNIHHNIKLSNILLDENGVAKVTGLKIITSGGGGKEMTQKSDHVYSCGVVLWEVLTGEHADFLKASPEYRKLPELAPFDLAVEILRTKAHECAIECLTHPDLRGTISPEFFLGFVDITLNCLSKQPSMDYVVEALERLQSHFSPGFYYFDVEADFTCVLEEIIGKYAPGPM